MTIASCNKEISCLAIKLNEINSSGKWFFAYLKDKMLFTNSFFPGDLLTVYLPCCTYSGTLEYMECIKLSNELWQIHFSIVD